MGKYRTSNLDLAAFITTKGYEPNIKYIHETMTDFIFPIECEKYAKQFYAGTAQVMLSRFIANRLMMKNLAMKNGVKDKKRGQTTNKYLELVGERYFYITGGAAQLAVFGKDTQHSKRKDEGNFYLTKKEAEAAIKAKQ